jgi:N-methylhydantoinase B
VVLGGSADAPVLDEAASDAVRAGRAGAGAARPDDPSFFDRGPGYATLAADVGGEADQR